jgi:excisionase family DNA binding protein
MALFSLNKTERILAMYNLKKEKEVTLSAYMTVEDVKNYLNLSSSKAYALTHQKDFPVCRFGSSIRIPRDAFLAWVEQKTKIPDFLTVA